jgi:hypothetical protein
MVNPISAKQHGFIVRVLPLITRLSTFLRMTGLPPAEIDTYYIL